MIGILLTITNNYIILTICLLSWIEATFKHMITKLLLSDRIPDLERE